MKTKGFIAVAVVALLMPISACATGRNHHVRVVPKHHVVHHAPHHVKVTHRPSIGTRYIARPVNGRFVSHNRERLWLANGILYRVISTRHGYVYEVVGFWR